MRRSPVLSIVSGWSHADGRRPRRDGAPARRRRSGAGRRRAGPGARGDVGGHRGPADRAGDDLVYRASLAQARGDVAGTVHHARARWTWPGPRTTSSAAPAAGSSAWPPGRRRHRGGAGHVPEAVRSLHAAGNLVDELDSTIVLADMWVASGRPSRARRLCEQALADRHRRWRAVPAGHRRPARRPGRARPGARRPRRAPRNTSRPRESSPSAAPSPRTGTGGTSPWRRCAPPPATSTRATQLLDQAEALYRPGFYPDVRPIAAMRARVQIAQGDLAAAEEWADDQTSAWATRRPTCASTSTSRWRGSCSPGTALTRRTGDRQRARTARRRARAARPAPRRSAEPSRAGSMLEIGMLEPSPTTPAGNGPQASPRWTRRWPGTRTGRATCACSSTRAPRCSPCCTTLSHADEHGEHRRPAAARPRLLAAPLGRSGLGAGPAADGSALADPLSERELEVLRLLDSDLTGPEIARELYVSLNTLRTHTKRIFTKLDVNTRAAAVRRGPRARTPLAGADSGADVTSPVTSCGDARSPPRAPRFQSSPRHPPRTDRNRNRT